MKSRKTKKYCERIGTFNTRVALVACLAYGKIFVRRSLLQAAKSSDSEDGTETETGEDGEDGEKEKEEKEKEGEEKTEPPLEDDTKKHGFLILSREDSTMVKIHVRVCLSHVLEFRMSMN